MAAAATNVLVCIGAFACRATQNASTFFTSIFSGQNLCLIFRNNKNASPNCKQNIQIRAKITSYQAALS